MPAPSKVYTGIPDSDIDPESPLTVTLMTAYRDNDVNAHEWIGGSYVPTVDHDHDGVNSKQIAGNVAGNIYLYEHYV